jgi:hypothetical protein
VRVTEPAEIIARYRQMLSQVLRDAVEDIECLTFTPERGILAGVYFTIVHSGGECAALLAQPTITVGGVMRGILESFADLCALVQSPDYVRRMLATFYDRRRALFADMLRDPTNPFHADLARRCDPVAELADVTRLLDIQRSAGFRPYTNFERLTFGDLRHEYRSLYWQLCLESHNSISAIEARHVEQTDEGVSLNLFNGNRPGELLKYYDSLLSIIIEASLKVHSLVASTQDARWQVWQTELRGWRGEFLPALEAAQQAEESLAASRQSTSNLP